MCKINVKKSILEIVEKNNLEILKIDLYNDEESFVKFDEYCEFYATLEDLDFEVESIFMYDKVRGMVYCQDKDTKEPVWIESRGDEGGSWWEVNRVPEFYKTKIMIQKQTWKDEIRILITDEKNLGSVQIAIPFYVSNIFGKADALIYALFVDNNHRRNGVAQRLLQLAEQQAKLNGVKTIGLEFNKDESESFVLEWYLKNGYKPFSKESCLLIKKLKN